MRDRADLAVATARRLNAISTLRDAEAMIDDLLESRDAEHEHDKASFRTALAAAESRADRLLADLTRLTNENRDKWACEDCGLVGGPGAVIHCDECHAEQLAASEARAEQTPESLTTAHAERDRAFVAGYERGYIDGEAGNDLRAMIRERAPEAGQEFAALRERVAELESQVSDLQFDAAELASMEARQRAWNAQAEDYEKRIAALTADAERWRAYRSGPYLT